MKSADTSCKRKPSSKSVMMRNPTMSFSQHTLRNSNLIMCSRTTRQHSMLGTLTWAISVILSQGWWIKLVPIKRLNASCWRSQRKKSLARICLKVKLKVEIGNLLTLLDNSIRILVVFQHSNCRIRTTTLTCLWIDRTLARIRKNFTSIIWDLMNCSITISGKRRKSQRRKPHRRFRATHGPRATWWFSSAKIQSKSLRGSLFGSMMSLQAKNQYKSRPKRAQTPTDNLSAGKHQSRSTHQSWFLGTLWKTWFSRFMIIELRTLKRSTEQLIPHIWVMTSIWLCLCLRNTKRDP